MLLSQELKGKSKVPSPCLQWAWHRPSADASRSLKGGNCLHVHCWATCQLLKLGNEVKSCIGADIRLVATQEKTYCNYVEWALDKQLKTGIYLTPLVFFFRFILLDKIESSTGSPLIGLNIQVSRLLSTLMPQLSLPLPLDFGKDCQEEWMYTILTQCPACFFANWEG